MIQLIIAADEPALFFSSVETAERKLEWIDVREGTYSAIYGRGGEIYRIWEDGRLVHIAADSVKPRPEELRQLLARFLEAAQVSFTSGEALPELLSKCERYCVE